MHLIPISRYQNELYDFICAAFPAGVFHYFKTAGVTGVIFLSLYCKIPLLLHE